MRKALVLGSDARICLGVIRSLGRGGVEVHIGWTEANPVAACSRYLTKAHWLPDGAGQSTWASALGRLMERERYDLVIPCTDMETIACQQQREQLEDCGRVYLTSRHAHNVLFDKIATLALARSAGIPTPREIVVSSITEARRALAQLGFPVVLKPRHSSEPEAPGRCWAVCKAYNSAQFERLAPSMLMGERTLAMQENFIGEGVGVELLLNQGEPLLAFQHVRVHEPLHGGPSSYRKSVPLSPELREAAVRILRRLSYTGVAMVEFKRNPATGAWVFLEVNARFWGSLPLAIAAGADFPLALFEFLVDGRTGFAANYRKGVYCRNLTLDLDWQRANWTADPADPTLATRPVRKVLAEAIWHCLTLREHNDTLTFDDPCPGLAELSQLSRRACSYLGRLLRPRRPRLSSPISGYPTSPAPHTTC